MTTAAATLEKPVTTGNRPPPLRHVYCRCDREAPIRVAFCGFQSHGGKGVPYDRRTADPDICAVCFDLEKQGCKRCSKK